MNDIRPNRIKLNYKYYLEYFVYFINGKFNDYTCHLKNMNTKSKYKSWKVTNIFDELEMFEEIEELIPNI